MDNIQADIYHIHQTYCQAVGVELALLPVYERFWWDFLRAGVTADDLKLVIADRKRGIKANRRYKECLLLRNICGSEEAIGEVAEEAAMIKARLRKPLLSKGEREIKAVTGRPTEVQQPDARSFGQVLREMNLPLGSQ